MSYFADLTPYAYDTPEPNVLNVGWLGAGYDYPRGETPQDFREALRQLAEHPILLHRGHHICELCPAERLSAMDFSRIGNGQIRVQDQNGIWYAAPTMICHYIEAHGYLPPSAFVAAVRSPKAIGTDDNAL